MHSVPFPSFGMAGDICLVTSYFIDYYLLIGNFKTFWYQYQLYQFYFRGTIFLLYYI